MGAMGLSCAAPGLRSRPRVHTTSDVVKSLMTSLVVGHRPVCTQPYDVHFIK